MKLRLFVLSLPLVFGLWSLVSAAAGAEQLWTCGMHPQIIKHEPGNCPICGMKLVPIKSTAVAAERRIKYYKSTMIAGEVSSKPGKDSMGMEMVPVYEESASGSNAIQIEPAIVQRMNLKTAPVRRGPVRREIRTFGSVAYSEESLRDITTKYDGWIEKLYVDTTWTPIKAGDPLFEIYSPDLYNAELNYIVARTSEGDTEGPLTRAALGRLQLFDVPKEAIAQLASTGKAQRTFVYRATTNGVVIDKRAVVGQMMKPGEEIYRTADLSSVWVLSQVYEQDLPFVKAGQVATVRAAYGPERTYAGTVALVVPQVDEQTRTATARIVLPNPDGALRPGMYVDVRFESQVADSAVLVPETAILRSGDRNTVFVARDGGTFEPREVKLGLRSMGGEYEVLTGLAEGERVVTSGQFMLDSESQLREAIDKMSTSESAGAGSAGISPASEKAGGTSGSAMPSSPRMTGMSASHLQEQPVPELVTLAEATADAAAALANDDFAGYERQRPAVNTALSAYLAKRPDAATGPLGPLQNGLAVAADLKAARDNFEPLCTAVTDVARAAHVPHTTGMHVFECPMAPANGKGRWLQRTAEKRNPFFGSAMPDCGNELPQQ